MLLTEAEVEEQIERLECNTWPTRTRRPPLLSD
jgi:hypothetical protein